MGVTVGLDADEHATPLDADCASGKHDRFNCFSEIAIAGGVGCAVGCAPPEFEKGLALLAGCRGHGFTFLRDGVQRVRWRGAASCGPVRRPVGRPARLTGALGCLCHGLPSVALQHGLEPLFGLVDTLVTLEGCADVKALGRLWDGTG